MSAPKHADPAAIAAIDARMDHLRSTLTVLRNQLTDRRVTEGPVQSETPKESERVINPNRPTSLEEMVGQESIVQQLRLVIAGSLVRGEKLGHILVQGAPGMGKTSIAQIVADETGSQLIATTGMMLKKPSDLVGLLIRQADAPTVLLIDEIHRMSIAAQETVYSVMEDGTLDVVSAGGNDAVASQHSLPHLVIIGATTRSGLLSQPFRDRFALNLTMEDYSDDELATIAERHWKRKGMRSVQSEALSVARRSKQTPRTVLHLCDRVLDYCAVQGQQTISRGTVANALSVFGIDANGMTGNDWRVIRALTEDFAGKPIGLDALSQFLAMDSKTISDEIEPWLARRGFLLRTKSGRLATAQGYALARSVS